MGSVKDLVIVGPATQFKMGTGTFVFSDRYSVFDWGKMPNHIPYKGEALCMTSAYFFEQLAKRGVRTHYRGVSGDDGVTTVGDVSRPSGEMHIDLVNVVLPERLGNRYNYAGFSNNDGNLVVPLEFIYRNAVPKGSSVFRRLDRGSLSLESMGLTTRPEEGATLSIPVLDISTKFEEFDRYPNEGEGENKLTFMRDLAHLSGNEIEAIEKAILVGNDVISEGLEGTGLVNRDGKFEVALAPMREYIMVVDAMGTLDECRLTYVVNGQDVEVSKEAPRQWYRVRQPEWVKEVRAAKEEHGADWKEHVARDPISMPPVLVEIMSFMYRSSTNAILERGVFPGVPELDVVVNEYQRFKELEMSQQ